MFPVEPVPDRIGAYEIIKRVGKVGATDVYSARMQGPLEFSREVTLKLVRFAVDDDARTAEELGREAMICARLNHPVVVRMFDFFEYDRRLVLVLEQVEGASLDRLMSHMRRRKQQLSDHAVFFIAAQLASALAHAHASTDENGNHSPIIHRDIKPENVLVGWDGAVRLSGFGLGKILGRTPDSIAGTVRGTPGYMAPEQTRGERSSVRSDVYGLGVLLWAMLTGQDPPLDGVRPRPISELRPDLPRELHAAIDAALEPAVDKRKITCADITQWLVKLAKMDTGREELRQKVIWLRATRGPAGKLDATAKAGRAPMRRQSMQAARSVRRTSSRPPSAFPKSQRRLSTGAPPPSARPLSVREGSGLLRIPPPPSMDEPPDSAPTRVQGASGGSTQSVVPRPTSRPESSPRSTSRGPTAPPSTGEPVPSPRVNVRTVTTPPPRTLPPLRKNGSAEASLAALDPSWDLGAPKLPTFGAPPNPHLLAEAEDRELPGFIPPELRSREITGAGMHFESIHGPASTVPRTERAASQRKENQATTARPAAPSNTFPVTMQIILAVLTAALVVALGLLLLRRDPQPLPAQVVTVEVARGQEPPPVTKTVEATQPPAPPVVSTTPPASAAAPEPPKQATPNMPDPSTLGDNLGYLEVKGPEELDVFLNGVRRGPTNQVLMVPCGHFFLRLSPHVEKSSNPYTEKYPTWVGPGQSAFVACRSATVILAKLPPGAAAPSSPR